MKYEHDNWFNEAASLITLTKEGSTIQSLIALIKLQKVEKVDKIYNTFKIKQNLSISQQMQYLFVIDVVFCDTYFFLFEFVFE